MRQVLVRFTGFRPVFSDKNSKNLCSDQAEHIHVIPLEPSRSHTTCTYITQELFEGSNFHGLLEYSCASMKIEPTKCCRMPISKEFKIPVTQYPRQITRLRLLPLYIMHYFVTLESYARYATLDCVRST